MKNEESGKNDNNELSTGQKEKANSDAERFNGNAQKIIHALNDLKITDEKRAFWELIQNAVDVMEDEKGKIIIEYTREYLEFKHNGKPFTAKALSKLIQQFSDKTYGDFKDGVGQNGTGFLTTHSFGKTIEIYGSMVGDGYIIPLEPYTVDRSNSDSKKLASEISSKYDLIFKMIDEIDHVDQAEIFTTFRYLVTTGKEHNAVKRAIKELHQILPYVLMISKQLKMVTVRSYLYNESYNYTVHNSGTDQEIKLNGGEIDVLYLSDDEGKIKVVLPINNQQEVFKFSENLPKAFLFYPLIGTEKFGFNFLVHHENFVIPEKRDRLLLDREDTLTKNKDALNEIFKIITNFLNDELLNLSNRENLASININSIVSDDEDNDQSIFLRKYHDQWVDYFINKPLVKISEEDYANPSEVLFIDQELISDKDSFKAIYSIINSIEWTSYIPVEKLAREWTKNVFDWGQDKVDLLTMKNLVESISTKKLSDFDGKWLITFYQFMVDNGRLDLFSEYALLPNIDGELRKSTSLKKPKHITKPLLEIARNLEISFVKDYVHSSFGDLISLEISTRKQLYSAYKDKFEQIVKSDTPVALDQILWTTKLCSLNTDVNTQESFRVRVYQLIDSHFNFEITADQEGYKQNNDLKGEQDFFNFEEVPVSNLIQISLKYFTDLYSTDKEVSEKDLSYLLKFLKEMESNNIGKNLMKTRSVFPNQNNYLRKIESLSKGLNFRKIHSENSQATHSDLENSEFIININEELIKDNIKDGLLHHQLNNLECVNSILTGAQIVGKIEDHLYNSKDSDGEDIKANTLPNLNHKNIVLNILDEIAKNDNLKSLFNRINNDRAAIITSYIDDEEVKDSMFKIIRSEDKNQIKVLGDLASSENAEEIINHCKLLIHERKKTAQHLQKMKVFGTTIEKQIEELIGKKMLKFDVESVNVQNGQDIILEMDEREVYYIEVKTRWNSQRSVVMSTNQTDKSIKNQENYALCSIDLSQKTGDEKFEVEDINDELENIRFVTDIGKEISKLIGENLKITDSDNQIRVNEYSTTVPQSIVKKGKTYEEFVSFLIDKLKLN